MGNEDHGRPETIVETFPTGTEITRDSRQVGQFWKKRRDSTVTERDLVDNVFLFVFLHTYGEWTLGFELLQGADRDLAYLFRNCDFLDVHLAMASPPSWTPSSDNAETVQVSSAIDSSDVSRNLSLQLHGKRNVVGLIENQPENAIGKDRSKRDFVEIGLGFSPRGVLMIVGYCALCAIPFLSSVHYVLSGNAVYQTSAFICYSPLF
jgi:hypothetical protein